MKGTRNGKTPVVSEGAPSLQELLSDNDDAPGFDYNGLDADTCLNLVRTCCQLGALVNFYYSRTDDSFCFSVRLGEQRRAYTCPDAAAFNTTAKGVALKLAGYIKGRGD